MCSEFMWFLWGSKELAMTAEELVWIIFLSQEDYNRAEEMVNNQKQQLINTRLHVILCTNKWNLPSRSFSLQMKHELEYL